MSRPPPMRQVPPSGIAPRRPLKTSGPASSISWMSARDENAIVRSGSQSVEHRSQRPIWAQPSGEPATTQASGAPTASRVVWRSQYAASSGQSTTPSTSPPWTVHARMMAFAAEREASSRACPTEIVHTRERRLVRRPMIVSSSGLVCGAGTCRSMGAVERWTSGDSGPRRFIFTRRLPSAGSHRIVCAGYPATTGRHTLQGL